MVERKGSFIGFYAPTELKRALQARAKIQHRALSGEVIKRLEESVRQEDEEHEKRFSERKDEAA